MRNKQEINIFPLHSVLRGSSSSFLIWEHVRNAVSDPTLNLRNQNVHL